MSSTLGLGGLHKYEADCIGAVVLDKSLVITAVSDGVLAMGGYTVDDLVGRSALDVVHIDDLERASEALFEAIVSVGRSADGMYRLKLGDGKYEDFAVGAVGLGPEHDNASIFQFREATMRLRAEEFARDSVEVLRLLSESHGLESCLERVQRIAERHINPCSLAVTLFDKEGGARRHVKHDDGGFGFDPVCLNLPEHVELALEHHLDGPWRSFDRLSRYEDLGDQGARITSVLMEQDSLLGYVELTRPSAAEPDWNEWMVHGLVRQVLAAVLVRVQLDEQLRAAANQDPLTGLANRRHLLAEMNSGLDLEGSAVVLIDLDEFSAINNSLGHAAGDKALVDVAERLRCVCPDDATVARFGGDEFVIWLPDDRIDIEALCERIRVPAVYAGLDVEVLRPVQCSIGVVSVGPGESAAEAIQRADEAMYAAKQSERKRTDAV